jgi:hypothetical protein
MGGGDRRPRRCFLSHATQDSDFSDRLADSLAKHGVDVFYSAAPVLGVGRWMDQIGLELDRCDCFLVVISLAAGQSPWVKDEVQYVLSEHRENVIPIRFQDLDEQELRTVTKQIAWPLLNRQIFDFTNFGLGLNNLLATWDIGDH